MDELDQKAYDVLTMKNPESEDCKLFTHNFFKIVDTTDKLIVWAVLTIAKDGMSDKQEVISKVIELHNKQNIRNTLSRDYLGDKMDKMKLESYVVIKAKRLSHCWSSTIGLGSMAQGYINQMTMAVKVLLRDKVLYRDWAYQERCRLLREQTDREQEEVPL